MLRERAFADAMAGRTDEATIARMHEAGLTSVLKPIRFGGTSLSATTACEILRWLARGDMSAGWVAHVYLQNNSGIQSCFSAPVLAEIFARPDARIASVAGARKLDARWIDGGLMIDEGLWTFNSGFYRAQWDRLHAPLVNPASNEVEQYYILVPTADVEHFDDWRVTGLRATGSTTVRLSNYFVPAEHVSAPPDERLHIRAGLGGIMALPEFVSACVIGTGVSIGAVEGALDIFLSQLPGRKLTYSRYDDLGEANISHLLIADVSAKLASAWALALEMAREIDDCVDRGAEVDMEQRARIRRNMGYVIKTTWEAIDALAGAAGASFASEKNPINRIWNDVRAGSQHALFATTAAYESFGRFVCGMDVSADYI